MRTNSEIYIQDEPYKLHGNLSHADIFYPVPPQAEPDKSTIYVKLNISSALSAIP